MFEELKAKVAAQIARIRDTMQVFQSEPFSHFVQEAEALVDHVDQRIKDAEGVVAAFEARLKALEAIALPAAPAAADKPAA